MIVWLIWWDEEDGKIGCICLSEKLNKSKKNSCEENVMTNWSGICGFESPLLSMNSNVKRSFDCS